MIHDADPGFSHACGDINPEPGQGHHCGGYDVAIRGAFFHEDLRLFWDGEQLDPERYTYISPSELRVTVPSGTRERRWSSTS